MSSGPTADFRFLRWRQVVPVVGFVAAGAVLLTSACDSPYQAVLGLLALLLGVGALLVTPRRAEVSEDRIVVHRWWGSRTYLAGDCEVTRTPLGSLRRPRFMIGLHRLGNRLWSGLPEPVLPPAERARLVDAVRAFAVMNETRLPVGAHVKWPMSRSTWASSSGPDPTRT